MPKVFATWVMTLKSGVTEEEFEQFLREEFAPFAASHRRPGTHPRILKGERGEGIGKYLMLNEFEGIEKRNSLYPSRGTPSAEAEVMTQTEVYKKFMSFIGERQDADWVTLTE